MVKVSGDNGYLGKTSSHMSSVTFVWLQTLVYHTQNIKYLDQLNAEPFDQLHCRNIKAYMFKSKFNLFA